MSETGPSDNVAAVFTAMRECWPNGFSRIDPTDPAGAWQTAVGDFSPDVIERLVIALMRLDDEFMPNPGRVRTLAKSLRDQAKPLPASASVKSDERGRALHVTRCKFARALCGLAPPGEDVYTGKFDCETVAVAALSGVDKQTRARLVSQGEWTAVREFDKRAFGVLERVFGDEWAKDEGAML